MQLTVQPSALGRAIRKKPADAGILTGFLAKATRFGRDARARDSRRSLPGLEPPSTLRPPIRR